MINCHCRTCEDARRKGWERKRFSVMIQSEKTILIDTSPDLRRQLLDNGVERIDAVIWTHCHFDHFGGFGEFYRVQDDVVVYTTPQIHEAIGQYMRFMRYRRREVDCYNEFSIGDVKFELVVVNHPPVDAVGVVVRWNGYKVAVTSDTNSRIPEKSLASMENADLLIIEALAPSGRFRKHMNAVEAMQIAKRLKAKKVVLTHLGHFFPPHEEAKRKFPVGEDYQTFTFGRVTLDAFLGD